MAAFINNDITEAGLLVLAKGVSGQQITYTRIVLGDGFLEAGQTPRSLTSVVSPKADVDISKIKLNGDGTVIVGGIFTNGDTNEGFFYRELGLYAEDPDNGEVLYCYGNCGNLAEWIPPAGGATIVEKTIDIVTAIGSATNVTASINPDAYATKQEIQAIQTTVDQLPDRKVCRFVVGTSTAGWTEKDCDYLCDGTDDQVEINAAITALPETGGEVIVLDGTYNITYGIKITKSNVTLTGNGYSTILKRANCGVMMNGTIELWGKYSNCHISRFYIDGDQENYNDNETNCGIYISGSGTNNIVTENICVNTSGWGIVVNSTYVIVSKNICLNNTKDGIDIKSEFNSITENTCNTNADRGLCIESSNNIAHGNICNSNGSYGLHIKNGSYNNVIGNTFCKNGNSGIYLDIANSATINGNICCENTGKGIGILANDDCVINGNMCNKNTEGGIYTINAERCSVTGNTIVFNSGNGITLENSNNNAVSANTCIQNATINIRLLNNSNQNGISANTLYCITSTSAPRNNINIESGSNNLIADNLIWGKNYTNSGTGNTFVNNKYN